MNITHITLINQMGSIETIQQLNSQTNQILNDNIFFNLNHLKQQRKQKLIKNLSGQPINKIFLTERINQLETSNSYLKPEALHSNFFNTLENFDEKIRRIENSIVIVNNNDIHVNSNTDIFSEYINKSEKTIFCAWDWDNHHWLSLSCKLAGLVDIYAPSHTENLYQLSRFNSTSTLVVPCATVQWSKEYLLRNIEKITTTNRKDDLLGRHIPYNSFNYRLSVIQKIGETCSSVGFSNAQFHNLTEDDKLNEWTSYKAHLIVPVLNDIPIRLFDAWNTGGIPIAPISLKGSLSSFSINENDILYYEPSDILDISALLKSAIDNFNKDSFKGIQRRFNFGLNFHHGNVRLDKIKDLCAEIYNIII